MIKWISLLHFLIPVSLTVLIIGYTSVNEKGFVSVGLFFAIFLALWLLSALLYRPYFSKVLALFVLIGFFIKELILANLKIAHDVLSRDTYMEPAIVALPLDVKGDVEIMLMANIITLTPGTLSLRLSDDRKTLYVHTLYLEEGSIELFKKSLKEGFEKKILAVTT
ncbi:MAG: Na+/H+ antiporter subunit E [Cyclobacteriaceae bacterium]